MHLGNWNQHLRTLINVRYVYGGHSLQLQVSSTKKNDFHLPFTLVTALIYNYLSFSFSLWITVKLVRVWFSKTNQEIDHCGTKITLLET